MNKSQLIAKAEKLGLTIAEDTSSKEIKALIQAHIADTDTHTEDTVEDNTQFTVDTTDDKQLLAMRKQIDDMIVNNMLNEANEDPAKIVSHYNDLLNTITEAYTEIHNLSTYIALVAKNDNILAEQFKKDIKAINYAYNRYISHSKQNPSITINKTSHRIKEDLCENIDKYILTKKLA